MVMLVNCSNCNTLLQLPLGTPSFLCPICQTISHTGSPIPTPSYFRSTSFSSSNCYDDCYGPPLYDCEPRSACGQKKALIIGISYKNTKHELKGCINDAIAMKNMLIKRFSFPESSILMLTEEGANPNMIPTKHNIRMAMNWLVQECKPGDSLVFHFSGHGSQTRNYKGDEIDGFDETICPLDFKTNGTIVDDEINAKMVRPLLPGVKLHALIDACHSGTALDLPYLCRMDRTGRYVWEDHRSRTASWKSTRGEVIFISGCDDDQTSADTTALTKEISTGAMTFAFIQAIETGQGKTYGSILNSMRSTIRNAGRDTGRIGGVATTNLTTLLTGGNTGVGLTQVPQLSANEPFDVYTKTFSL